MTARGILREEVLDALRTVEVTYTSEDRDDRTVILCRTGAGRRLKVVVETDDPNYVVTVADRDDSE